MSLRTELTIATLVSAVFLGGLYYGLTRVSTELGAAKAQRFITSVRYPVNEAVQIKADGNIGIVTETGPDLVRVRFWTNAGYTWVLFRTDDVTPLHRKTIKE